MGKVTSMAVLQQAKLEKRVRLVSGSENRVRKDERHVLGSACADWQVKRKGA